MDNLEITARTVDEAIKKALAQLNTDLDKVEVTVLNEGKGGILGIGAEDARISVKVRPSETPEESQAIQETRQILSGLLEKMGFHSEIEIIKSEIVSDQEAADNPIIFNITGDDTESLVGRRGQTIDALQYLVRLMLSRKTKSKVPIMIDVDNYKQKRYEDLRTLALNVAEQVKVRRTSIRLEPMAPYERRIVHTTLANDPEVTTESIGDGESRKVVVYPKTRK